MGFSKTSRDQRHLGLRIFKSDAGSEPSYNLNRIAVTERFDLRPRRPNRKRPPEPRIVGRKLKASRHHSDHDVVFAGHRKRLAQDVCGSSELLDPKSLTQDDNGFPPLEILRRKR